MTLANFMPSGRNEVIVRIYSYQNKCPQGTVSSPRLSVPASFSSLTQLLMAMEGLMDRENSPQRGEEPRLFQKTEIQLPAAEHSGGKPIATFRLSVLFRQNASWQGSLIWVEQAMDAQFRSVLELVRLMDSALISNPE